MQMSLHRCNALKLGGNDAAIRKSERRFAVPVMLILRRQFQWLTSDVIAASIEGLGAAGTPRETRLQVDG